MTPRLYLITRLRKISFRILYLFFAFLPTYGAKRAAICSKSSVTRHGLWITDSILSAFHGFVARIQVG